jgi:tetratricopeptide (TPR) repeat protein
MTRIPFLLLAACLLALPEAAPAADQPRAAQEALDHYKAGRDALSSERYQQAAEEFGKAIDLDPLLVLAHYGLGQAEMALKDYPAAVRAYLACRDAFHKGDAARLQNQAQWEQRLDEQIRSLQDQLSILSSGSPVGSSSGPVRPLSSMNPQNLQQQLDTLRAQRQHQDLAAAKTPAWISVALGGAYFRTGAFADAEREYKAALEIDPKLGEAHNNLAVVYLLTKRGEDAQREVKLAEKSGFKVPEGLKRDVEKLRKEQQKR